MQEKMSPSDEKGMDEIRWMDGGWDYGAKKASSKPAAETMDRSL